MPNNSSTDFRCNNFCRPLVAFANSSDTNQDREYVGPDLDPNYSVPERIIEKVSMIKHEKYPACKETKKRLKM